VDGTDGLLQPVAAHFELVSKPFELRVGRKVVSCFPRFDVNKLLSRLFNREPGPFARPLNQYRVNENLGGRKPVEKKRPR
jgi:hypothetical protein